MSMFELRRMIEEQVPVWAVVLMVLVCVGAYLATVFVRGRWQ